MLPALGRFTRCPTPLSTSRRPLQAAVFSFCRRTLTTDSPRISPEERLTGQPREGKGKPTSQSQKRSRKPPPRRLFPGPQSQQIQRFVEEPGDLLYGNHNHPSKLKRLRLQRESHAGPSRDSYHHMPPIMVRQYPSSSLLMSLSAHLPTFTILSYW